MSINGVVQPVFNDEYYNRKNMVIFINDLYTGELGSTGDTVAKVGDMIINWNIGFFRCIDVTALGIPTLQKWDAYFDPGLNANSLVGAGNTSYRLLIDTTVNPYVIKVDSRLSYHGSGHSHYKVFLGEDYQNNPIVISAYYNQNGQYVGENIPMELVQNEDPNNLAVYGCKVGSSNRPLQTGDKVTVIAYDDTGEERSITTLLVVNTSFIRNMAAAARQVLNIGLKAPFISTSDPRVIEWPNNAPLSSGHLMGTVTFNSGTVELPIDQNKFRLYGIEGFIPGRSGQNIPMVLSYRLSSDEYAVAGAGNIAEEEYQGIAINKAYRLVTVEGDGAYSVNLFVYPRWVEELEQYRLEYWLYNQDRQDYFYVTPYVLLAENSPPFDPVLFGTKQSLIATILLSAVSPIFRPYQHVQSFSVSLMRAGNIQTAPNWLVEFDPGQNPAYGTGLFARYEFVNSGVYSIDLSMDLPDVQDWLQRTYYASKPIFNPIQEPFPPEPTHVIIHRYGQVNEIALAQWDQPILVTSPMSTGELIGLRFIRRTDDGDLQLAYCGIPVWTV